MFHHCTFSESCRRGVITNVASCENRDLRNALHLIDFIFKIPQAVETTTLGHTPEAAPNEWQGNKSQHLVYDKKNWRARMNINDKGPLSAEGNIASVSVSSIHMKAKRHCIVRHSAWRVLTAIYIETVLMSPEDWVSTPYDSCVANHAKIISGCCKYGIYITGQAHHPNQIEPTSRALSANMWQ